MIQAWAKMVNMALSLKNLDHKWHEQKAGKKISH